MNKRCAPQFPLRCAAVQLNPTVGALEENANRILDAATRCEQADAHLALFPELALCGYPPEDLILRPHFMEDCARQIDRLAGQLPGGLTCIVGAPVAEGARRFNAAVVFQHGRIVGIYRKMLLPNYGVFDEKRVFDAGREPLVIEVGKLRVGIQICEDSWLRDGESCRALARLRPDLVVNLSASPYHRGKRSQREAVFAAAARELNAPLLFCNQTGGQDELVFDGASSAFDATGTVLALAPPFKESILFTDKAEAPIDDIDPLDPTAEVYEALKTGLRDYVDKNRFASVVVAVSGGIDSALVLAIAADALGPDRVRAVTMPSVYSSSETLADAVGLCANLGVQLDTLPIAPLVDAFHTSLHHLPGDGPTGLAAENLQARIRGTLIMTLSNTFGQLVLTTGNKSEFATGYCTLYGDMAGGLAVIKDVPKTLVYDLCRWRNRQRVVIPPSTITRPPSAELRPDQKDSDSLPPYEILDPILEAYVEHDQGVDAIVAAGFDRTTVERVVRLVDLSEYKRRQGPPGIRITPKAFGRDRRMPITNGYAASHATR